jgi:glutathione synthase/RimK-type ligase-like ATP-grasp enzyme
MRAARRRSYDASRAVLFFADHDDTGIARVYERVAEAFPAKWWKLAVPESTVDATVDQTGFIFTQGDTTWSSQDLERTNVVIYKRRYLQPRGMVCSELPDAEDRAFAEREWSSLLEAVLLRYESQANVTWVNSPTATLRTSNKLALLLQAGGFGLQVPETCVSTSVPRQAGPLVTKAISTDERIGPERHLSTTVLTDDLTNELGGIRLKTPALLQRQVAAVAEYRCFYLLGRTIVISLRPSDTHVDIRHTTHQEMAPQLADLPEHLTAALGELACAFALNYCTFDLLLDVDGQYSLIDVTPSGSWAYYEEAEQPFLSELLADIVIHSLASLPIA